jgi:hypothetical protein
MVDSLRCFLADRSCKPRPLAADRQRRHSRPSVYFPDNLRIVATDARAGIAANIVSPCLRCPEADHLGWGSSAAGNGVEILTVTVVWAMAKATRGDQVVGPVLCHSRELIPLEAVKISTANSERTTSTHKASWSAMVPVPIRRLSIWVAELAFDGPALPSVALATAATFRMRWVATARAASLRGSLKDRADGGMLSVRSGWSSSKSSIRRASRHR